MKDKNRQILFVIAVIMIVLLVVIALTFCSKNKTNNSSDTVYYDVHITYNATFPNVCTYYGEGDATLNNNGDHANISGTITVGQETFSADFQGTLSGNVFTLTTTVFQVQYEYDGVTYTEEITIDIDDFSISGTNLTITGSYTAVTNPGNTTESGTITIEATETGDYIIIQ